MDKAVILARGLGTRMKRADQASVLSDAERAAAESGVKAMIPIDRPFLDYVLSALADAGYRHVCLIVAPDHAAIREYYRQVGLSRVTLDFSVQPEPKGTADAVAAAERFSNGDPFLVVNSDNYYPIEALRGLREQAGFAAALFERDSMLAGSNIAPERVKSFAIARSARRGSSSESSRSQTPPRWPRSRRRIG